MVGLVEATVAAGATTTTGVPPPVAGVEGVSGGGACATTVGEGAATIPARFGLIAVPTTTPKPSAMAAKVLTV